VALRAGDKQALSGEKKNDDDFIHTCDGVHQVVVVVQDQ